MIVDELRGDPSFMEHVRHWHVLPAREAQTAPMPAHLDARVLAGLASRGITELYSHQAQAYRHVRDGHHVVVVTPTASGKTLTYNLPVLDAIAADPAARALYLFPTKALSQDQQAELNEIIAGAGLPLTAVTYDGDTPPAIRTSARAKGQIVITNPDMLHAGIMPNHTKWVQFFQNLRYIVVDELHTYRGIFGSHVTNVVRRLKRIAEFYGSHPQFIMCSATIGNPADLARSIVEAPVELVGQSGAPSGEKHIVLYNPPLVDRVQGIRQSVVHAAHRIALRLLTSGTRTIVFARSRQRTELIASYLRASLENTFNENHRIRVESYRGGYLPGERRAIEKGLRDGEIHGVVSTNALELGIDIGGLDAAVLSGYPGSIASALQQAGRAGRRQAVSLAILIASSSPLDQFIVEHPEFFFATNPERAYVNPDNPYVLFDQLKCALFDLPLADGESYGNASAEMLSLLEEEGVIRRTGNAWHWADQSYPAEGVSLRSAASDNVVIVDQTGGADEIIGEMDRPSAKELLFDNAIYIHRGEQFVVTRLDLDNRRAYVERSDANYFTDALMKLDLKVLTEDETADVLGSRVVLGDVLVRSIASKFKKLRYNTHENIGYGEISLPGEEMHTRSAMIVLDEAHAMRSAYAALDEAARPIALRRTVALLRSVAPVVLMSVSADLGVHASVRDPHFGEPTMFLYDRYPGGSGLADAFVDGLPAIAAAAAERITSCRCEAGCPSCVGPIDSNDGWNGNPKAVVNELLQAWLISTPG